MKKYLTKKSRVTSKFQTVIPTPIRDAVHIQVHSELVWHVIENEDRPLIFVTPVTKHWSQYLSGLGKDIWEGINTDDYLRRLKSEWKE